MAMATQDAGKTRDFIKVSCIMDVCSVYVFLT